MGKLHINIKPSGAYNNHCVKILLNKQKNCTLISETFYEFAYRLFAVFYFNYRSILTDSIPYELLMTIFTSKMNVYIFQIYNECPHRYHLGTI